MKFKELDKKDNKTLLAQRIELKKELFNLRMQRANGSLQSTARMRECRRDVARVMTKMRQLQDRG